MTLQDSMLTAIHRTILANPERVPEPLLTSAKRLDKAYANRQKAYANRQKAYADWEKAYADCEKADANRQKAYADYEKAYAKFREMLAQCSDKIQEFLQ
jgi:hypothetical protein